MRLCSLGHVSLKRTITILLTFTTVLAYIQLRYMDSWSGSIRFNQRSLLNTLIADSFRDVHNGISADDSTRLEGVTSPYVNDAVDSGNDTAGLIEKFAPLENRSTISFSLSDSGTAKNSKFTPNTSSDVESNTNIVGEVLHLMRRNDTDTNYASIPLMLLFSSWVHTREKAPVHAAIIRLWSTWPFIKNAVVTSDSVVKRHARLAGWHVEPVTHVHHDCFGPPVLAPMFTQMMSKHSAHYFGFSNSDILFGNGLAETLKFLYEHDAWRTKPLLIVGRRYNVNFLNETNIALETPNDVEELTERGTLVLRSTDYFFTNKHFPWRKAPEVSIGRPFVVRAIIGFALKRNIAVIDATKTIEAVHLTTKDGIFASWHKRGVKCNEKVMAKIHWNVPTKIGHCECALLETFKANGQLRVRHREANRQICS